MTRVLFGSLKTDQPDLLNGDLEEAENCIPYIQSYGPFPSAQPYSQAVPQTGDIVGALSVKDLSSNVITFIGSTGQLYKESATVIDNLSRTASYTTANDARWEFDAFGNTMMAVNGTDPLQVFTAGSSTRFLNASASASAPIAAHISVVRDFVFLGNIANAPNRVQWSQINNPLRYTVSQRYQSDFQDLPGSSQRVQRITGGDFATILTESSVWRATYVGAPLIFRFDEVAPGIGCLAPGSVARFQALTFFLAHSGPHVFDGTVVRPIGTEEIAERLLADLNRSFLHRISAAFDPERLLYMMSYPSKNSATGDCDRIIVYSLTVQRWSFVSEPLECLLQHMTAGYTLEGLDVFGSLDNLQFSLDSSVWQGGIKYISGIDPNRKVARFEGAAKTARFVTGEAQITEAHRTFLRDIRPLVQGDSSTQVTCCAGGRDLLTESVSYGAASPVNATGHCPVRKNNRFHRIKMEVSGGFERVMGVDLEYVKEGRR